MKNISVSKVVKKSKVTETPQYCSDIFSIRYKKLKAKIEDVLSNCKRLRNIEFFFWKFPREILAIGIKKDILEQTKSLDFLTLAVLCDDVCD